MIFNLQSTLRNMDIWKGTDGVTNRILSRPIKTESNVKFGQWEPVWNCFLTLQVQQRRYGFTIVP